MILNLVKMTKLILPERTRERIAQEYELEKKLEGRPKKEKSTSGKLRQSDGVTGETAERLAKEHNMSLRTVERSADLFRSPAAECMLNKPLSAP